MEELPVEARQSAAAEHPRLHVEGLRLAIEGNPVLRGVDLSIPGGRITALAGPNGAGKSSIIKCLSGYYREAEAAQFSIDGAAIEMPSNPKTVRNAGLRVVHQDLGLVPDLSTFDNVALAAIDLAGLRRVPRRAWDASIRSAVEALGGTFDIHRPVRELRPYERVLAAVARASYTEEGGAELAVLILDEVTAALPAEEVEIVLDRMRRVADRGVAVLFVTHHFDEILEVADDLVVAREGRAVVSRPTAGLSMRELTELVFGEAPIAAVPTAGGEAAVQEDAPANGESLRAVGVAGVRVRGVDLALRAGTIIGVTGRVGSGKSELGRLLAGRQQLSAGEVTVASIGSTPGEVVGYVPQDRDSQGVIRDLSVSENLHLGARGVPGGRGRRSRIWNAGRIRAADRELLVANLVKPPEPDVLMKTLSGGNQQKVMFLRALADDPAVVIVDEPTIGVDVVSRAHLHAMLRSRADAGAAVLIISSEAEEVLSVADGIHVMTDGRLGAALDPASIGLTELEGLVASGGADEGRAA